MAVPVKLDLGYTIVQGIYDANAQTHWYSWACADCFRSGRTIGYSAAERMALFHRSMYRTDIRHRRP